MKRPDVIVPIQLGCCPDSPRCLLCNPPPDPVGPEKIEGLVAHYSDRAGPDDRIVAWFFGGAPPKDEQVAALHGLPFAIRVRPDLFSRADADRLIAAGCVAVELDVLSFDDEAVRGIGRSHRKRLVLEQAQSLAERGVRVGVVLSPGLPGTSAETCLADARQAAEIAHTARLHPVLVLRDAGLREPHMDGRYEPLSLGDAVTVCRRMLDLLEQAGVQVLRIGQQPGPDELGGRAVAGPQHSSFRELVESRRTLDSIQGMLVGIARGSRVAIRCAPADVGRVRGPRNQHVRTLRADHGLDEVQVRPDPELPRGRFEVEVS